MSAEQQQIAAAGLVLGAVLYLFLRQRRKKRGCGGGCGCTKKSK